MVHRSTYSYQVTSILSVFAWTHIQTDKRCHQNDTCIAQHSCRAGDNNNNNNNVAGKLSYREPDLRHVDDGAATSRSATEARLLAVVQRGRARRDAHSDPGRRVDRPPAGVPAPAGESERQRRRRRQTVGEDKNAQRHGRPTCQPRLVSHKATRRRLINVESRPA